MMSIDNIGVNLMEGKDLEKKDQRKVQFSCNEVIVEGTGKLGTEGLKGRVDFFKKCGPSAQLLILENGGWNRLDHWTKFAIHSQDGPLIKEILNILLTMPTSCSQLLENQKRLPMTIQHLLERLVRESQEFGEDSQSVKMLACEVFAKWLLVKKKKTEPGDMGRILIIDGEVGSTTGAVVVPIKHMPGFGYLAENGAISLIEIKAIPAPRPSSPPPLPPLLPPASPRNASSANDISFSSVSSGPLSPPQTAPNSAGNNNSHAVSSAMDVGGGDGKASKPNIDSGRSYKNRNGINGEKKLEKKSSSERGKQTPTITERGVRITLKSRSESLLAEMMLGHSSEVKQPLSQVSPKSPLNKRKIDDKVEQEKEELLQASKKQLFPSSSKESPPPPPNKKINNVLQSYAALSLEEFEKSDLVLSNIGLDLGKPKKMVRWWGHNDGVLKVHCYESCEVYEKAGFEKEKWSSITMLDSDDEANDSNDSDKMVIDEEQDCVVEMEITRDSSKTKEGRGFVEVDKGAGAADPWPVRKIKFANPHDIPLQAKTTEMLVQRRRESMVVKVDLSPSSSVANCPEEPDEVEIMQNGGEDNVKIASTGDVIGYTKKPKELTKVYDYSKEKWPEVKGTLDPRAIKRHSFI